MKIHTSRLCTSVLNLFLLSILYTTTIYAQLPSNSASLCFDEAGNLSLCVQYDNIPWSEDEQGLIINMTYAGDFSQFVITSDFAEIFDRDFDGIIDEALIDLSDIDDLYDYLISQGFDTDGDGNLDITPDNLSEVNEAIQMFANGVSTNTVAITDHELPPLKILTESGSANTDIIAWLKEQQYYLVEIINTDSSHYPHGEGYRIGTCTARGLVMMTLEPVSILNWLDIADDWFITDMKPVSRALNSSCQLFNTPCNLSTHITNYVSTDTDIHFDYTDIQDLSGCQKGGKELVLPPPPPLGVPSNGFIPEDVLEDVLSVTYNWPNPLITQTTNYYAHGLDFIIQNNARFNISTSTGIETAEFIPIPMHLPIRRAKLSAKTNLTSEVPPIRLYPNPCHQDLHIDIAVNNAVPTICKIYNSCGELMQQQPIHTNGATQYQHYVQVSQWPQGKYYCVVQQGGEQQVHSFIKM